MGNTIKAFCGVDAVTSKGIGNFKEKKIPFNCQRKNFYAEISIEQMKLYGAVITIFFCRVAQLKVKGFERCL